MSHPGVQYTRRKGNSLWLLRLIFERETGCGGRIRTSDQRINNPPLYQLSYATTPLCCPLPEIQQRFLWSGYAAIALDEELRPVSPADSNIGNNASQVTFTIQAAAALAAVPALDPRMQLLLAALVAAAAMGMLGRR